MGTEFSKVIFTNFRVKIVNVNEFFGKESEGYAYHYIYFIFLFVKNGSQFFRKACLRMDPVSGIMC